MSRSAVILLSTLSLIGSFVLGVGVGEHRQEREDSTFVVTPTENCIPEKGWTLKHDYNGKGTAYIVVQPKQEAEKASKEKK